MKVLRYKWLWLATLLAAASCTLLCAIGSPTIWCTGAGALATLILIMLYFAMVRPMQAAARGMELLRGHDYSNRLARVGLPDADRIVDLFNSLMDSLKEERLLQNERNSFLTRLIDASPMGILILGFDGEIETANPWARTRLGFGRDDNLPPLDALSGPIADSIRSLEPGGVRTVNLRWCGEGIYRISRLWFMDRGFRRQFIMIESLTDEVRLAEKSAYAKVIRLMAHEVNNTLAGMQSTLETLAIIHEDDDPDVERLIAGCTARCRSLGSFISSYADVVKIPAPRLERLDIARWLDSRKAFLESVAHGVAGQNCSLTMELPETEALASFDEVLLEQALVNIVKNAAESIRDAARTNGNIRLTLIENAGSPGRGPTLTVADNGSGISPEAHGRLFSSFYTSKTGGQGLGLMFVAEILSSHGCRFSLEPLPDASGATFRISFPRQ